jgi:hypothetical protein
MYPMTGYTRPEWKYCIRCGEMHHSTLYRLCDDCRQDDVEHLEDDRIAEHDRQSEILFARTGY